MARGDVDPRRLEAERASASVGHWHHAMQIYPGVITPGAYDPSELLPHLDLPDDCSQARVLDVGARDGFFAFELERRGAAVVAVDPQDPTESGFAVAAKWLGS